MAKSDLRSRFEAARKAADDAYARLNRELSKCEKALESLQIGRDIWHCYREEPAARHYIGWAQRKGAWHFYADKVCDDTPDDDNAVAVLDADVETRRNSLKNFPALLEKCTALAEQDVAEIEQSINDAEAARKFLDND